MNVIITSTANIEVDRKTLDLMDGFGFADGSESCSFTYDNLIEYIEEGYSDDSSQIEVDRWHYCIKIRVELDKLDTPPNEITLILE